jgi:hypothetical protein
MSIIPAKSMLDYAKYYFSMGIYVYPHCQGNRIKGRFSDF